MRHLGVNGERIEHNFTGQTAIFTTLKSAAALVKAEPSRKVLCIIPEANTTQFNFHHKFSAKPSKTDKELMYRDLMMGDGCVAFIVEAKGMLEISNSGSFTKKIQ
eukprot:UN34128